MASMGGKVLLIRLGLDLAGPSRYFLRVAVERVVTTPSTTEVQHGDEQKEIGVGGGTSTSLADRGGERKVDVSAGGYLDGDVAHPRGVGAKGDLITLNTLVTS